MARNGFVIWAALALWIAASSRGAPADAFESEAPFAVLVDFDSGETLYAKNADQPMAPASTAKLMTAEIVFSKLKSGALHLDDQFFVSEHAWRTGGAHAHGSAMFLDVKSRVRIEDLLRGLIVQSGNDAAIVLAEGVAGTEENFALQMNERAAELGMTNSNFTSPWGKPDPKQVVTAFDMARLAAYIIRNYPEYYHFFGEREFTWNKIRQLNRNPLLGSDLGVDGLKTGDTTESGFGLIASGTLGGRRLIEVVNGLKTGAERADEARRLLAYGLKDFDRAEVFASDSVVGFADVYGGAEGSVPLVAEAPIALDTPRGVAEKVRAEIVYLGPLVAPIAAGAELAHLRIWRGDLLAVDAPLKTERAVAVGGLGSRAIDATLALAGDWLRRTFTRTK